jgi:putative membrane protein
MAFVMLAFWGLLIWTVVMLVRHTSGQRGTGPTPEEVLAERFARGEIDEDEYQKRRDVLRRNKS